jgi:hypothetical protein
MLQFSGAFFGMELTLFSPKNIVAFLGMERVNPFQPKKIVAFFGMELTLFSPKQLAFFGMGRVNPFQPKKL